MSDILRNANCQSDSLLTTLFLFDSKTTLVNRLLKILGESNVCYLAHDSYYHDQSHKTPAERAKTNFDHPDSLETALLIENLQKLKQGQNCQIPVYDFATHSRIDDQTKFTEARKIILLDGILLFTHPDLAKEMDIKVFVVRRKWDGNKNLHMTLFLMNNPHHPIIVLPCIIFFSGRRGRHSPQSSAPTRYQRTRPHRRPSAVSVSRNGATHARSLGGTLEKRGRFHYSFRRPFHGSGH